MCLGQEVVSTFWESWQHLILIDYKNLMRRVTLSCDVILFPKKPGTLLIVSFDYLVSYGSFFLEFAKLTREQSTSAGVSR